MKFITEEDLRDLYKSTPFTTYTQPEGTRLTPGARQFLVDWGIDMYRQDKKAVQSQEQEIQKLPLKTIQDSFLTAISETMKTDPALVQVIAVDTMNQLLYKVFGGEKCLKQE